MKHLRSIAVVSISSALLMSCGAGKKLTAANAENAKLNSTVTEQAGKLAKYDKEIAQLKTENIQYGKEATDCRTAKAAIAQKLDNLNQNLAEKGTSMKKIKEKVQTAIDKFEGEGATVTYKNGLVHINYTDDFFFKSVSISHGPHFAAWLVFFTSGLFHELIFLFGAKVKLALFSCYTTKVVY